MPKPRPAAEAPAGAALAHIDRILAELSSPSDPEALNEVRAAFRKKVPLHLRSYAAAALLLEASRQGAQRGDRRRDEPKAGGKRRGKGESARGESSRGDEPRPESQRGESRGEGRGARRERAPEPREAAPEEQRPRLQGEGTTIFFGMGKRQRLYSRVLLRVLSEEGGLALEDIGDIRSFDNYSFADVAPERAEELIAALASFEFRGRVLPVNKARKRGEAAPEPREDREPRGDGGERGRRDEGEALAVEAGFDESLEDASMDDEAYGDEAPLGEDLAEDDGSDASYDEEPADEPEDDLDEEKDEDKAL